MKKLFIIIITLLLVAGACIIILLGTGYYLNRPMESPAEAENREKVFKVEKGESVSIVARKLENEKFIRSKYFFIGISKFKNTQASLKSGYYKISTTMSTIEIHNLLVAGTQKMVKVTIPEGLTARKIGVKFDEAGVCSKEDFLKAVQSPDIVKKYQIKSDSVEGYMYPDTYMFHQDVTAENVVEHLVDTMFEKISRIYPEYDDMEPEELHDKIIIASIVEREYRNPDEAAKIASVFYNRLKINMPLQSCATVVYVLTEIKGEKHPEKLTYSNLEVDSKFNTYEERGLPPAPIANPGINALEAVFHPADTDYLYFLLKDQDAGSHVFSKTLSDHDNAYRLYIKQ